MRFVSRRLLAVVVAIAVLGLTPVTAGATDQEEVERAEAARREAYERLVTVNAELDAALLRYNEINAELDTLEARIEVIEERIAVAEVDMAEMQERAEELVTEAYMAAGGSLLELAFEAQSLQDMLTSQALLDRAADADLLELNRLDAVTRETDRLRQQVEQDRRRVEQLGVEAAAVVDDLEDLREERDAEYRRTDEAARQAREEFEEAERARKLAEPAPARGSPVGWAPSRDSCARSPAPASSTTGASPARAGVPIRATTCSPPTARRCSPWATAPSPTVRARSAASPHT